jgi:valyl-tRNA synthetase
LARFYPASVLETGYDILFFWVARMVMLGLEFTDKAPFHTIYMHGLVRDGQGQKMSKTTGNVIDPLETIDKFGCDALRYSLVTGSTPGQDIPLSMERIESNRNFANKLWNAGKYLQNTLVSLSAEDRLALAVTAPMTQAEMDGLPLAERYIVSRCHELVDKVTTALEEYSFGDAGRQIYEFLWDEYADWYIEISKTRMRDNEAAANSARRVLVYVWDRCMRLLHPFMPFLTEALWQLAPHRGESIMVADWPQRKGEVLPMDAQAVAMFGSIQALVRSVRNARAEYNVEPGKKIAAFVVSSSASLATVLDAERAAISLLGRVDDAGLVIVAPGELPASLGQTVHLIVEDGLEVFLPMSALVDAAKELARLGKQAEKLKKDIDGLEARLASQGFADKAPESVINEVKGNIAAKREELAAVEKGMVGIGAAN